MKRFVSGDCTSLKKTYERRPDLLEHYQLTVEEEKMLAEIKENKE